ncbi:MAG TPA: sugar-transfer associated ATP-grasp domain-containing protein [Rhodocyclaceae bacterium]|nr:sugar-transfer associated ATP-grasp domain-containing protein [Rhodocyclaceae bacterium]
MAFFSSRGVVPVWRLQYLNRIRPSLAELIHKEWASPLGRRLTLRQRLDCWKQGFLSESSLIYDFQNHRRSDYVTDYARFTKTRINGVYTTLLSNKVMFDAVMRPFQANIPKTYALLSKGKFHALTRDPHIRSSQDVVRWCMAGNDTVLKPLDGGGGSGIIVITVVEGGLFHNGEPITPLELVGTIERLDRYLIQDKIEQADYARIIYPRTTNTIRALTMWDAENDEPFVAVAVQRFGSARSHPVDNWTQGGFSAAIDLATGELSKAVTYPATGKLEWRNEHPDTGERIAGTCIPDWPAAQRQLLDIARAFPYWRCVGWDIVLGIDGTLKILEANHRSDVNLLQVHGPLLRDPRVRKFYEHN